MWMQLEPHSAKLEQVFQPLHERASEFKRMWSIAELRLAQEDVTWLRSWFESLTPESPENWISVLLARLGGEAFRSYRQMFGALLICAGGEVCREESREDSVWPVIRRVLPKTHPLRRELFLSNGQPSVLTKEMIADAVGALNLRNAMDIEGTQQWFVTMKLQFGFTHRGAKNRLAEWLVDLGKPTAVQYLNGETEFSELRSESFQSLWRALRQYRRGLILESEIRHTLHSNPWVKPTWIDGLLTEARARVSTLGTGDSTEIKNGGLVEDGPREEFCPLLAIGLEWHPQTAPRMSFQLDRTAIEEQVDATDWSELDFYVDGRKRTRWLRQRDGTWAGNDRIHPEPAKEKTNPNLSPKTLTVRSRSGDTLAEWDLADSGLSDEVLVFDLDRDRPANAGLERLQSNRSYGIICDRNCEIQGCDPVEVFERNSVSKKALRLAPSLSENLCITYGDFVLWQPVREDRDQGTRVALTLGTEGAEILSLRDRTRLVLEGLPSDAKSVELLIHKKTYELQKEEGRWRTFKEITITPELAAGQRRLRVRFEVEGKTTTQQPRLALNLLGAAMLRREWDSSGKDSLEPVSPGKTVNRSGGTAYLRVWVPGGNPRAPLFEADSQSGRLRYGKFPLRALPGHGGLLQVRSDGTRYSLGILSVDNGCIGEFTPALMHRTPAQLGLLSEKDPSEAGDQGYDLVEWEEKPNHRARINRLPPDAILRESTRRLWLLHYWSHPLAIALTWKGNWLGSWWNLEKISDYVQRQPELREADFAVIKWLRLPLMHPMVCSVLRKAILATPHRFIRVWSSNKSLPEGLRPHEHIIGLDSVIRHFLWNDFPVAHVREATSLAGSWPRVYQEDLCVHRLADLSGISPLLLWKGMERCLKSYKLEKTCGLLKALARSQVGLPSRSGKPELNHRLRAYAEQTQRATGIAEERLKQIVEQIFRSMNLRSWQLPPDSADDSLKLGETRSGRIYLSVRMALHWLRMARQ